LVHDSREAAQSARLPSKKRPKHSIRRFFSELGLVFAFSTQSSRNLRAIRRLPPLEKTNQRLHVWAYSLVQ
jgi:hypothetical protein